ncbi:MAG: hypothetical protein JSR95_15230 [Proteobacteria bacterium]|nr:hypothetical protein [Pseudomonadota bacterium]
MGAHMKTMIDILALLLQLKRRARRAAFKLQDASVSGKGLQPDAAAMSWEQIRRLSYEGHGG